MKERFRKLQFGDLCIKMGFMTPEKLEYALGQKEITQERLGKFCLREELLDEEQVAMIIAAQYYYEYIELEGIQDPRLLELVPSEMMTQYQFIPYEKNENNLVIAMYEPLDIIEVVDTLEVFFDMPISVVISSETKIKDLLKKIEAEQSVLESASDTMRLQLVRESDKGEETLSVESVSMEESPIVKLVDSTVLDAINKKASDIHIQSSETGVIIRYRIDGMLHQATEPLNIQHQSPVISRIKIMSELDISEKRIPQDGRFKLKIKNRNVDFRVSILPTVFGEDAVIRILDRESLMPESKEYILDDMNLPSRELSRIRRMVRAPYGMFLVTGPTGSGKTTTLYTAVSEVNQPKEKIITIEDPVEYQLKGIVQIPVNEKKGLTFAKGLRAILRHDPDKILLGEIRDAETAQIALQSALTGHLVFTTVHANSSFEVISRFIHMGIEPYNLVAALNCIVAQRLIRMLCDCKDEVPPEEIEEYLRDSGLDYEKHKQHHFFKEKELGCDICRGAGFKGRRAIIELIEMTDDIKEIFLEKASISALKKKAKEAGTTFLREAALELVLNGDTTMSEANRVTFVEA